MHRPLLTQATSSRRPSRVTRLEKRHFLIARLQPAVPVLAGKIAFPLLLLTAGLLLVQPCAGQNGTWTGTGSLVAARYYRTATLLLDGRVLVAAGLNHRGTVVLASAELYDPWSGARVIS